MKFSFAVSKMKRGDAARAKGHNLRTHNTNSQLRREAWFLPNPITTSPDIKWNQDALNKAEGLAKRKDAVVALEFVLQIGNQSDWREPPTKEFPEGKPKKIEQDFLVPFFEQALAWVDSEFGRDNLVGMQLHTDESSPHMHIIVTPVTKENKLQAKQWLDGGAKIGALRKRCYEMINQGVKCEYTPNSGVGGEAHDVGKRAGTAPVPGLIEKITGKKKKKIAELTGENEALAKRVHELESQLRRREKAHYSKAKLADAELALAAYDELKAEVTELTKRLALAESQATSREQIIENGFKAQMNSDERTIKNLYAELDKEKAKVAVLTENNNSLADQNNDMIGELRELKRHGYSS